MKRQEFITLCASLTNVPHAEENLDFDPSVQTSATKD